MRHQGRITPAPEKRRNRQTNNCGSGSSDDVFLAKRRDELRQRGCRQHVTCSSPRAKEIYRLTTKVIDNAADQREKRNTVGKNGISTIGYTQSVHMKNWYLPGVGNKEIISAQCSRDIDSGCAANATRVYPKLRSTG